MKVRCEGEMREMKVEVLKCESERDEGGGNSEMRK